MNDQVPNSIPNLSPELRDLAATVATLLAPYSVIVGSKVQAVIDSYHRRTKILILIQDALVQLRLDMKYLVFDLEATRRERDNYKQRCGE